MERYNLLMDEQVVIGWDNLTTHSEESSQNNGKYNRKHSSSEEKGWIQDCMNEHKGIRSEKLQWTKMYQRESTKQKRSMLSIIPIIQEIWADRCTDRNKPVLGG